jgi:opacity protein-like surface antigen
MRLRAILSAVILCLPVFGMAQSRESSDVPSRGTVFGGYSLLHTNNNLNFSSDFTSSTSNFNGWEGQGTFNFARHLGVTADFTGNSSQIAGISFAGFGVGARQHIYQYLFGPTVSANFGKSSVFAHALFGMAHQSLGAGVSVPIIGGASVPLESSNAFAMAFGGGVDIGITRNFAVRAAQIDFVRTNFNSLDAIASGFGASPNDTQNSLRYSGGVVWRF